MSLAAYQKRGGICTGRADRLVCSAGDRKPAADGQGLRRALPLHWKPGKRPPCPCRQLRRNSECSSRRASAGRSDTYVRSCEGCGIRAPRTAVSDAQKDHLWICGPTKVTVAIGACTLAKNYRPQGSEKRNRPRLYSGCTSARFAICSIPSMLRSRQGSRLHWRLWASR